MVDWLPETVPAPSGAPLGSNQAKLTPVLSVLPVSVTIPPGQALIPFGKN